MFIVAKTLSCMSDKNTADSSDEFRRQIGSTLKFGDTNPGGICGVHLWSLTKRFRTLLKNFRIRTWQGLQTSLQNFPERRLLHLKTSSARLESDSSGMLKVPLSWQTWMITRRVDNWDHTHSKSLDINACGIFCWVNHSWWLWWVMTPWWLHDNFWGVLKIHDDPWWFPVITAHPHTITTMYPPYNNNSLPVR